MDIKTDDVIIEKATLLKFHISRFKDEFEMSFSFTNISNVEAMILNIQRACQATLDIACHIIVINKLGLPKHSSDAFQILYNNKIIDEDLLHSLQEKVKFRNFLIHKHETIDNLALEEIVKTGYKDYMKFCNAIGIKI